MNPRVLYDTHMHTPLCKHAFGQPEVYAAKAAMRGLKGIIFTCHNPMPPGFDSNTRMEREELDTYIEIVGRCTRAWAGRLDVRLGLEVDFVPGIEIWLDDLLRTAHFHYIIGSVHPQLKPHIERYWKGDQAAYIELYYDHIARSAESGLYDSIGHPDIIKNLCPDAWNLSKLMGTIRKALDRVARAGVAMEVNTSGIYRAAKEPYPTRDILVEIHKRGIPVTLGSDAHQPARVGDQFELALDLLADVGFTKLSIFLDRMRKDVPIADARASLVAPKPKQDEKQKASA